MTSTSKPNKVKNIPKINSNGSSKKELPKVKQLTAPKTGTKNINFGIRGKLFASFGTAIALIAGVGFIGWQNTNQLKEHAKDLYENELQEAIVLANAQSALWELRYGFPQFIAQPDKRADILATEPKLYKVIKENLEIFKSLHLEPKEEEAYKKLENAYNRYIAARPRWFELMQAGKIEEAAEHRAATTTPYGKETVEAFATLINLQRTLAKDEYNELIAEQKQIEALLLTCLFLALGLGAFLLFIVNRTTRPILDATKTVEKLGQGKLDTRVPVAGRDELAVLGANINSMAAQLQNLLQEQEVAKERAQLLVEIAGSRVSEAKDLDHAFNLALTRSREILNVDRVVIYRFNPDGSGYVALEAVGESWAKALNSKIEDACIGENLLEAYRKGRVVPTNNVLEAGFHPEHQKLMERLQIKANLVTPIVQNEQLYGLLIAHHCAAPHNWQQPEIEFLKKLAIQLGLVLYRSSFLEQTRAEGDRSRLMKDITLQLAQSVKMQSIFDTAVQQIRPALKTDRVVVYSFNHKWQGTIVAESVAEGFPKALGANIDDPCFAEKYVERYRQGRVQATNDIYKAGLTQCHLKQLEPFSVKANLVAPIIQNRQLIGLLIAHQCNAPRIWQQAEIDLFTQLATQVGLTLERVDLLEQQKAAKEELQKRALELLQQVDPVSRGDLTIRATVTEDEIGTVADSYNATILSLRKIVTQVQTAAKQMATTTSGNETLVQDLSAEALRQTEEITAALNRVQEMANSIRAVALSAEQAGAAVQEATQTVQAGDAAMNRTVEGILAIQGTVAEATKKVNSLGESSKQISQVVNLIGRFAAQTNLLALKASIEAARAGEEGRGFAVLADEVRALASQSAQATSEIETLVTTIQTETKEVVAAMEAGTEQVAMGTLMVDETRQSLNKITEVNSKISELVQAIAQATVTQSQSSESVTQNISDVAVSANNTSKVANNVSASFKDLLALAQDLQASAGKFKVS